MLDFFFKVLYKQKFNVFDIGYRIYYTREEVVYIKKSITYFHLCLALPKISEILCFYLQRQNTVSPLYIHVTSFSVQGVNLILRLLPLIVIEK